MGLKRTFALKAYTFPLVSLPYKNICYLSSSLLLYFRYAQVTVLVTEIIKSRRRRLQSVFLFCIGCHFLQKGFRFALLSGQKGCRFPVLLPTTQKKLYVQRVQK